jgi:DNA-binding transcriptional LysR family regulator
VLTVNQFFTAGRIVAQSDLLTVLPVSFIEATGYEPQLAQRPLPMPLGRVHVDMLWHLRNDDRSAQRWLRARLVDAARQANLGANEATIAA